MMEDIKMTALLKVITKGSTQQQEATTQINATILWLQEWVTSQDGFLLWRQKVVTSHSKTQNEGKSTGI